MKIRDLSEIPCAPQPHIPIHGLLCGALRSPAEVSFSTHIPELAALWRPARELWEQNQRLAAIGQLTVTTQRFGQNACISIPTMLLATHLRMENGDTAGAERCLQAAVRKLGQQTEMKPGSRDQTPLRFLARETPRAYALRDRDWLILAIHALLKNDLESCLLWIHQADCRVFDSVAASESPRRLRLIGDLHAALACIAVQTNELEEAEKFLATAYQKHCQAEAFQSICRDLILTSRLAIRQGQTQRANSLLDAAECQLVMSLMEIEADRSPLMDIIRTG